MGGHAYICQDCVRSLPEAPSIPCMTRDTVCVCLCLPCLLPPPPTASSRCSLLINLIIGGRPRLHVSRLHPILARGSIHPVYHGGHCVCVCVCLPLPASPPPNASSRGGARPTYVKIVSDLCPRLYPSCVSRATLCVCVCVFLPLHAPPPPSASSRCS